MNLDDVPGRLEDLAGMFGVALAQWSYRETAVDKPAARRAATTAVEALDSILGLVYDARSQLVAEVRLSDDQAGARVDALLARVRGDGP